MSWKTKSVIIDEGFSSAITNKMLDIFSIFLRYAIQIAGRDMKTDFIENY